MIIECSKCQGSLDDERDAFSVIHEENRQVIICPSCLKSCTETHPDFWDCECPHNYMHHKLSTTECDVCNTHMDDGRPDSHMAELFREGLIDVTGKPHVGSKGTAIEQAVNPKHYKTYMVTENDTLQWLEAQQYLGRYLLNPKEFAASVELQVRKYLDRCGKKDDESQEVLKAFWYMRFLAAFTKNGLKPIRVADIPKILEGV